MVVVISIIWAILGFNMMSQGKLWEAGVCFILVGLLLEIRKLKLKMEEHENDVESKITDDEG